MLIKTKKWGNSLALIIPRKTVKELDLRSGDEIFISQIEKKGNALQELFGSNPGSKLSLKEFREKEIFSKYD
jgi:hypothetical protein